MGQGFEDGSVADGGVRAMEGERRGCTEEAEEVALRGGTGDEGIVASTEIGRARVGNTTGDLPGWK